MRITKSFPWIIAIAFLAGLVALLFSITSANAQSPPPVVANAIKLGSSSPPVLLSTHNGSPNGVVTGDKGDTIWDYSTPAFWQCQGGTSWDQIGSGNISGTLTAGIVPVATGTNTIGNGNITDNTGTAAVNLGSGSAFASIFSVGSVLYDGRAYGMTCNGSTDDSTAFLAAITAAQTTAGTVQLPAGTCIIDSCIQIPNYAPMVGTLNEQNTVEIRGAGRQALYLGQTGILEPGTTLVMNCSSTGSGVAKIETYGIGSLTIDDLTLQDTNTDTTPFIYDTLTTVYLHNFTIIGGGSQDAIVLGGTDSGVGTNLPTSSFTGYGSLVDYINFDGIETAVRCQSACNGVTISNTFVGGTAGSSTSAPFVFGNVGGDTATADYLTGNTVEIGGYEYGVRSINATGITYSGNGFYDPSGTSVARYRFETGAGYNGIMNALGGGAVPPVSDANGTNSYVTSSQAETSVWVPPWTFEGLVSFLGLSTFEDLVTMEGNSNSPTPISQLTLLNQGTGGTCAILQADNAAAGSAGQMCEQAAGLEIEQLSGGTLPIIINNQSSGGFVLSTAGQADAFTVLNDGSATFTSTSATTIPFTLTNNSSTLLTVATTGIAFDAKAAGSLLSLATNTAGNVYMEISNSSGSATYLEQSGTQSIWQSANGSATVEATTTFNVFNTTSGTYVRQIGSNTDQLLNASGSSVAVISTEAPSVNNGTLSTRATDYRGIISTIGATTTTLTFGDTGFTYSVCNVNVGDGTLGVGVSVTDSATAPTFSCWTSSTGAAVNCPNLNYTCTGIF